MIPEAKRDLLERPIVVTLVTLMPDGQPQATPVWFSYDGTYIYLNSAKGRQKDLNMRNRPQVTILSIDPENPYRYLEVRGEVVEIDEKSGLDHINFLSNRYLNREDYYEGSDNRGKEIRVKYKVQPKHAH